MKNVTIGKNISNIGSNAFILCFDLTDVYYGGSKEDWEKIHIASGNEKLLNATIHYNSPMPSEATPTPNPTVTPVPTVKPTADPSAPSVEITEVWDGFVTAKVNNCDDLFAQVILAVYNKNGALIEMQESYNFGEVIFLSENLQNVDIKVMLWSDTDSMKPLAETAEISL